MNPRNLVLCCVVAVAGCSSAGSGQAGPVTTVSVRPNCVAIADDVRGLATELSRLATGDTTVESVRAAADELGRAVEDARTAVGEDARVRFEEAGHALRQLLDSLAAQPTDWAGVRAAADALATALRDAADLCGPTPTS